MSRMPYCSRRPNRGGAPAGRAKDRTTAQVMEITLLARMISVTGRAGPMYLRRAEETLKHKPEQTTHDMPVSHSNLPVENAWEHN